MHQVWWSLHRGIRQGWAGGLWWMSFYKFVEISRGGGSTWQPQRTEPCQCVSCQPWTCHRVLQDQMQILLRAAGAVGAALRAAAGLGSCWFVGVAVLLVCGDFQRRRQHWATTAHKALPVCDWPALSKPRGIESSNAAPTVCGRRGGTSTRAWGRAGQEVFGGCVFAGLRGFSEEEAALGNHSARCPASV